MSSCPFIACIVNFSRQEQGVWKLPGMLWILLEIIEKKGFLVFSMRQTSIKFAVESADQVEICLQSNLGSESHHWR